MFAILTSTASQYLKDFFDELHGDTKECGFKMYLMKHLEDLCKCVTVFFK